MNAARIRAGSDRFVADLLSYMTLGEKIGQLDLFRGGDDRGLDQAIISGEVGGIASITHAARWQGLAVERSRLGIPLLLFEYPCSLELSPWAIASSWDEDLSEELGRRAGMAAVARGSNALWGPRCAIATRPLDEEIGIVSCEALLTARMAEAFCRGASQLGSEAHRDVLAMVQVEGLEKEAARYAALALAHCDAVIAIDSSSLDAPTAARAGFDGLLVAECARLHSSIARRFAGTRARSLLEAAERAIGEGQLREEEIDAAVCGVLHAKHALGLFRDPRRTMPTDEKADSGRIGERVRATMVLLRNEAGILPFSPVSDRVLVIGDAEGAAGLCVNALERAGIGHVAAPGFALRRKGESWVEPVAGDHFALALTRDAAKRCDFMLVALEDKHFVRPEEGAWRIPGPATMAMLRTLAAVGPRLVAIVATTEPVDLADADQHFAAVLHSWEPREGMAEALGEILSGRWSPQGRMPVTAGRFAFGHGLGFNEATVSEYKLEAGGGKVTASAKVANSGSFALRETVQVYRRQIDDTLRLIDFRKVDLAPGETAFVSFDLGLEALGTVAPSGRWELAPGTIAICMGKNIRRVLSADIEITADFARAIVNRERGQLRLAG